MIQMSRNWGMIQIIIVNPFSEVIIQKTEVQSILEGTEMQPTLAGSWLDVRLSPGQKRILVNSDCQCLFSGGSCYSLDQGLAWESEYLKAPPLIMLWT